MIYQIQKKEYDKVMYMRKSSVHAKLGYLVFKGDDGKYYKCDESGMKGSKEIFEFNKKWRSAVESQTELI